MTIFDYLVLFIMICSVVISVMRGLAKEVISVCGWVAAFVLANAFAAGFAEMLPDMIPGAILRLIAAFVILFISVRLLAWLLGLAVESMIEAGGMKPADRFLGMFFGATRGVLIVLTAVILFGMTAVPKQDFWKNATLSPLAESAALVMLPFLPGDLTRHVRF
ncbi:CvpA family protein [Massilia sp. W12]|uniref:CvpA family protein n=1 Tax=Massilia sp. W12 TaxID=3126507 RepID=UPI0030D1F060